jgi:predicted ester cyclase
MNPVDVVRRLVDEVWNGGRLDLLAELYADPFDHGGREDTVAGLLHWHHDDAQTWADIHYEIVDEVCAGETVALHWRATARQAGPWGPVPPTGRTISWDGVHFITVRAGRIVKLWAMADTFSKATQLGARILPPESH